MININNLEYNELCAIGTLLLKYRALCDSRRDNFLDKKDFYKAIKAHRLDFVKENYQLALAHTKEWETIYNDNSLTAAEKRDKLDKAADIYNQRINENFI